MDNHCVRKLFISLPTQAMSLLSSSIVSDVYAIGGDFEGDFYLQKKIFSSLKKNDLSAMNKLIQSQKKLMVRRGMVKKYRVTLMQL